MQQEPVRCVFKGYKSAPLRDISLSRCKFDHVEKENVIQNVTGLHASDVTDQRAEVGSVAVSANGFSMAISSSVCVCVARAMKGLTSRLNQPE